jgi:hypothetical protein
VNSPLWLRRIALPLVLLGVVHLLAAWPMWSVHYAPLPLETGLTCLFMYLGTGLWIMASGVVLGFLAESDKNGEEWAGPFARGVTNFLAAGGILACALMWSNPVAWILGVLSVAARLAARKPPQLIPRDKG